MSTNWELRCARCDVSMSADGIRNGDRALRALASTRKQLVALAAAARATENAVLWGEVTLEFYVGEKVPLEWWLEHGTHELELVNEYGDREALP